jgi:glycosyltransferase involved in cell wall biosynthesis
MISIVIPAYNEESSIGETIGTCHKVMSAQPHPYEIVVVDDGSLDNTHAIAIGARSKVVRHPHNVGYGRSLKDGIAAASYDIIAITDADGTYPIDRIPELVAEYQKGFDMVVGARQGKHYDESFSKMLLRVILRVLVEYTAGRKIPDINSGLRVFSRQTVRPYHQYLCDTFSFTTSLTLAYMMNGKFVQYLPIAYEKRVGKTKVRLFRDSLRTMQFIVEAMLYYNPIKVFLALSVGVAGAGVLAAIAAAVSSRSEFYGIAALLLVSSLLTFCVGLVSVQLKQLLHLQDERRTGDRD